MVLAFQLISSTIFAQVPQKMSYQAVIRDASKALVTNKTIGMRVRIAQGTQSGTIVYTETFSPTTNINGLVSLEIGGAAGFSTINWANGPYFILTDADLTGGTSYTISGYSQLVSVPYALHAKTAESITGSTTIPSGVTLPTPVSPTGSFFFRTDENILYVSNGTAWLPLSTHGSTPSGTTFPTPTNPGDVFFNTANKNFYYWDGTTWKLVSNIPSGTALPAASASVVGDPFFRTDTNILYVFNGTSWNPINGLSSTLAEGSLFVGNASNVATPTTKANIPISGFGAAAADVSLGNKNITNLATPLIATDAANKLYVDSKVSTNLSGPTLPAVGPAGNTFFNTTDKVFYISDGTKWLPVATDGSTPSGPTFPPLPAPGDVFYNTATNSYYYYDGATWKITSNIPTGTSLPLTGTSGEPFFKSDTNTLYVFSNGIWNVAGLSNILANGSFFVGNASNIATPTAKVNVPLSGFGVPTTDVSMGSQKLTNLLTPTVGTDAANKAYVDAKTATTPSGPTNPPAAGASVGDVFYNTATKSFYYFDGTDWKLISSVPIGPTLPPTGNPGDTFYNTTTNSLYVYNNGTWNPTKVQADWTQNTVTADDYIKNKPTRLGQFTNDLNFVTMAGLPAAETDPIWSLASANYYTKTNMQTSGGAQLHFNNLTNKPTTLLGYGITDGGTVTSVSVVTANGVSGTVATPTTTPAISLTLGNITPTSVAATGTVTGSNISGTNTGDQNASQVAVTPTGNISSTDVQAALVELQGDINGINTASHAAVTIGTANGLSLIGQQLSLAAATAGTPGALSPADKDKLDKIASGAEVNVQADWAQVTNTADDYIKNKPAIVSAFTNDAGYLTAGTLSANEQDPIWNAAMGNYYTSLQLSTNFAGSGSVHWLNITNTPTTLIGYGITDGMSNTHPANGITATNITNWNSAFNWGNHNLAGYLTTETDPLVAAITGIVKSDGATISAAIPGIDYVSPNSGITGATKTKITYDSKGLVTAGANATTADISSSIDKRYVTDSQLSVLANTSGINTGDQTLTGLGAVPTSRSLTINGVSQDLSADRTFSVGTVTSVTATSPLSSSGGTTPDISISKANATTDGYLSLDDWNTFNNKESSLTAGNALQYYRGDKTWQTLNKAAVGLANVDNTSDLNKPISTATQGALNLKENVGNKSTDIALGTSNTLYPTQNAVKNYVDNQISNNSTPDATTLVKGKLKLAGDLGGTADLPEVLKIRGASLGTTTATNSNILIANGTSWESQAMSGDITMTNAGVTTIGAGKVTDTKLDKSNIPISGFGSATTNISLGSQQITNLGNPTLGTDAANKNYVDNALVNGVPGKLYQGTTADVTAFNSLSWASIAAATDIGSSIPSTICTLDLSQFTWIAFPKAWGAQNFFFKYGAGVYAVFDGFEKRIISAATTGTVDYQVWVFKTVPNIPVDLIVNN